MPPVIHDPDSVFRMYESTAFISTFVVQYHLFRLFLSAQDQFYSKDFFKEIHFIL